MQKIATRVFVALTHLAPLFLILFTWSPPANASSPAIHFTSPTAEIVSVSERYDLGWVYPDSNEAFIFQLPAGGSNAKVELVQGSAAMHLEASLSIGTNTHSYKGFLTRSQGVESARLRFPFDLTPSVSVDPLNVQGASFVPGRYRQALSLDGVDDFATFSAFSSSTGGAALWIRPTSLNAAATLLSAPTFEGGQAFALQVTGGGELEIVHSGQAHGTGFFPAPGLWTHIAISFDGFTGRLYVNGQLTQSFAQNGDFDLSVCPVQMGRRLAGKKCGGVGEDFFAGEFDDVALYDQPLSTREIEDHRYDMISFEARLSFDLSGQSQSFFIDGRLPNSPHVPGPLGHRPGDIYLTAPTGEAVYLTGSHTWDNLQDWGDGIRSDFQYSAYLDLLAENNHNFFRLWAWESRTPGHEDLADIENSNPLPWVSCDGQTIDCYDLYEGNLDVDNPPNFEDFYPNVKFNPEYFQRLATRVQEAREKNIFVGVMFFQGHSVFKRRSQDIHGRFDHHPFNQNNNLEGVHADFSAPGEAGRDDGEELHTLNLEATSGMERTVASFQKAYVRKVVETLNALDNVLWEISNESLCGHSSYPNLCSFEVDGWQNQMTSYIREVESGLPYQHAVGMTGIIRNYDTNNIKLFNSRADWISPGQGSDCPSSGSNYGFNPLPADGNKVLLPDSDHIGCVLNSTDPETYREWTWTSMMRGLNPILMDAVQNRIGPEDELGDYPAVDPLNPAYPSAREYLGDARFIAQTMQLQGAIPDPAACSTQFCLIHPGIHYAVYSPQREQIRVNLAPGSYRVFWLDPSAEGSELIDPGQTISVPLGGNRFFGPNTSRPIPFPCGDPALCDVVLFLETTALPDLLPDQVKVNGDAQGITLFPGQTNIFISAEIKNDGEAGLEAEAKVEVFYSQDIFWDSGDQLLDSGQVQNIAAGESRQETYFVATFPQVALGTGYILVVVDGDTQVAEAQENNNTQAVEVTLEAAPAPSFPPLEITGVSLNKAMIGSPYDQEVPIHVVVPAGGGGAHFYIQVETSHNQPRSQVPSEILTWTVSGADLTPSFFGLPENHSGIRLIDGGLGAGVYDLTVTAQRQQDTHTGQPESVTLDIRLTVEEAGSP